ncbi:MAG TPA: class III lanthionine synthetase LanKC [Thermoanaerobaculia bacterium]|jgi:serine/threonine protein kinase|nr:class III lanthionine synthetase LanKC [Thermoanaerobaculia bacterium]
MSSVPKASYTIADKLFYEPLDRYEPDRQAFFNLVKERLPADWQIVRKGVWFNAVPFAKALAVQGWKIHVSATQTNAEEILRRVVPILTGQRTVFKFGLDRRILSIMTGKNWHRGGSGKFITIYPDDQDHFIRLIEEIHQATAEFEGPYILSDRRYRDSRVVFYRYGGLSPVDTLTAKGEKTLVLSTPEGETVPDERQPYFVLPSWVEDPFGTPAEEESAENTLKGGRYEITSVLAFSNSGGVYLATDRESGDTVVIKEARPHVNTTPSGEDAVALLRKEYRLLQKLDGTGVAPRPIDFFTDWEHSYLAEEYLGDVPTLRLYGGSVKRSLVLLTQPSAEAVHAYWADYKRIFTRIAEMLAVLHERGIVFMDVSMNNILLVDEGRDLKLIDFEGAFEPAIEKPTYIFTPGFVSYKDMMRQEYQFESDYYAFGALMIAYILPINGMLTVDPTVHLRFIRSICEDFGLPGELLDVINRLLDPEPSKRATPAEVIAALGRMEITRPPAFRLRDDLPAACGEVLRRSADHWLRTATEDRADRLFPSDPKLFVTNPLSLAYGASGVAYALNTLTGSVPQGISDWILRQSAGAKTYPPGLYLGLSGIAWALWDMGFREPAERLMRESHGHPGLEESADLFYGAAGWGLAQLRFFLNTGDERYLDQAILAGTTLARTAREEDEYRYWPEADGGIPLGLGHGASGISLFLLYLSMVTGDEQYLDLGRRALDFDLAQAESNPEGHSTWRMRRNPASTMLPYLRYGTAGIGLATVRYNWLLGGDEYRAALEMMHPDVDRKYAIFPGRFIGLTGMGEFLLDLAATPGFEERAEASLRRLISGLLLFQVETEKGAGFPGYELFRLSTDIGTGSAGVALFLHRYLTRRPADFLVDELFAREARPAVLAGAGLEGGIAAFLRQTESQVLAAARPA